MKIENITSKDEKVILTGLIVNEDLIREVTARYEPDLFPDKWSNLLCQWCVQFYGRYKKPPGKSINNLFRRWAEKSKDKSSIELIDRFLSELGDNYKKRAKEIHASEVIDLTLEYLNKVKLARIKDELEAHLDSGDILEAEKLIAGYRSQQPDEDNFVNPYLDKKLHKRVFKEKIESIIKLQGPWAKFFGDQLARENFIAFQAPEKGGKSFMLQEICHQGAISRRNVIFFGIGDMSLTQTVRRMQARIAGRPLKGKKEYWIPKGWKSKDDSGLIIPKRRKLTTKGNITLKQIERARRRFQKGVLRSDRDMFKLLCKPALSVDDIQRKIEKLIEKENWKPDIIALDYADLLEAPAGIRDKLDQIDHNWRKLRNMALEFNALMLTATQSRRSAYKRMWQGLDDVSDNKKKAAHITGMVGINCSEFEKERDVRRLNWPALRETTSKNKIVLAGSLGMANPCVLSTYWKERE